MLYPKTNAARSVLDLSGVWQFRLGENDPWETIAVPASYNDQKADRRLRSHVGFAWYRTQLTIPAFYAGQRRVLRFDAVTHDAVVWLDGKELCRHCGGFLPFEADITKLTEAGKTYELLVCVDNRINHSTLPVGNEGGVAFFGSDNEGIPSVEAGKRMQQEKGVNLPNFDFFNYAGITRPVRLYTTPMNYIEGVTLDADMHGMLRYRIDTVGEGTVQINVLDADGKAVASCKGKEGTLIVPNARLWQPYPGTPYLYTARIRFGDDLYEQHFGFRSVEVHGHEILLNGKAIHLHGPCKHEDLPFHGRGLNLCANVVDISLYRWLNANVLRMSHYPYAEEMYDLCDREGIMVVDETPAVGIGAGDQVDPYKTFPLAGYHAQVLRDMIARDRNHPSVVMWSLGNEPDTEHFPQSAYDYWKPLYDLAHELDTQNRPVTMVCCQNDYTKDLITRTMDVVCINRYYGWYNLSGDLETAKYAFNIELDFWEKIDKPLILSEYGADTVAGLHNVVPEMFSEEFQIEYYEAIHACLDARAFVAGEFPWNFADFNTQQGPMRSGGNRKGLFTRDRTPKMAAHYFRRRWEHFRK
ncbi:MAG: beta-glucuronidase [Clostridia bacterium]|nr:beta-glucuronidase [Clostridia bacterium]